MIEIRPDPAHPQGGHALLVMPADAVQGDAVPVSVRDNYADRYLGKTGFQATQVAFGPYPVLRSGTTAQVVIGPEIVNQIEEYTPVRLTVGDLAEDLSWPDTVVPAPGAPALGGLYQAPDPDASALSGVKEPVPTPLPADQFVTMPAAPEDDATVVTPVQQNATAEATPAPLPAKRSALPYVAGGVLGLVLAAVAAYLLVDPQLQPDPVAAPVAEAPPDPCATETLDGVFDADGFAGLGVAMRQCAETLSPDAALGYVERAAAQGDATALALFGQLYDAQMTDPDIETRIGLTFGDAPDRAAEYYHRAAAAGSFEAEVLLDETCPRLAERSDTLSQSAFADYCTPE